MATPTADVNTSQADSPTQGHLFATQRRDAWWLAPLATAITIAVFIVYATWRAAENAYFEWESYHSPFYSPYIHVSWISPAMLVLWVPAGFRLTCYYARKAYYRTYFADPPACAVGEARQGYRGETAFPFILQNIHRYFLLLALVALGFQWYHAYEACIFNGKFSVGIGTLVLLADVFFLTCYVFSCHSLRHIVGGGLDCFSKACLGKTRYKIWCGVSKLNCHHMKWFWLSLFSVGVADFYIRFLAVYKLHDIRLF